jgi:ABC-type dipeptide/oligopeptide/nickel transport system ATPase component
VDELVLNEPLVVKNLCKVFKKGSKRFYAVDNLNFGVASAECFGLLGLNGAGKTTTIEILTGQLEASKGKAYLNGFNVKKDRLKAIGHLGICPQFVILQYFYVDFLFSIHTVNPHFIPWGTKASSLFLYHGTNAILQCFRLFYIPWAKSFSP